MDEYADLLWAEITAVIWETETETVSPYDNQPINVIGRVGRVQPTKRTAHPIPDNPMPFVDPSTPILQS
jgi:hypothetical protein